MGATDEGLCSQNILYICTALMLNVLRPPYNRTLTRNIRERRGENVSINVPSKLIGHVSPMVGNFYKTAGGFFGFLRAGEIVGPSNSGYDSSPVL